MKNFLHIFALLTILLLLSACDPAPTDRIVQSEQVVVPAVQPSTPAEQKVVTLVPEGEQTTAPEQPVEPAPNGVIDEKAQETVIANLRTLLGAPTLELAIKGLDRSPNATNYQSVLFVDSEGNNYYIHPETLQPVEFNLGGPQKTSGSAKTPDELRAIAEEIAKTHSIRFEDLKDNLTYREGNKGENHFFRWEMPDTDVGDMPALLQVGLKQDGSLFSYINSLDFLP